MTKTIGSGYGRLQLIVCAVASVLAAVAWVPLGVLALLNLVMNYRSQRQIDNPSRETTESPRPAQNQRTEAAVMTYMATSITGIALIPISILLFVILNFHWLDLSV